MKKFTFLIIALLAIAGYAKAEVDASIATKKVTAVGAATTTIDTNAWYLLYNQTRGCYVSEETSSFRMRATSNFVAPVAAADKAGYLYQFESTGNDNEYYIKSGNGLYFKITDGSSTVSTEPVAYTIAQIGDNAGHFYGVMVSDGRVLDGNAAGGTLAGWGTTIPTSTGGNNDYQFLPLTMEEASYIDVTYNFTYNNEVKYTQTSAVEEGSDFPDYTVTLPYGVTAAAKPTDKVSAENATQDIELTVSGLPFTASTLESDGSFGENMHWYTLTLRGHDLTYNAASNKSISANVAAKTLANFYAFTGNPFDGYKLFNYVAGSSKIAWSATVDDSGTAIPFTELSQVTDNTDWMLFQNGEAWTLRREDNSDGYINERNGALSYWTSSYAATDAGSKLTINEVTTEVLTEIVTNYKTTTIATLDEWATLSVVFDAELIATAKAAVEAVEVSGMGTFAEIDSKLTDVTDAVATKMFTFRNADTATNTRIDAYLAANANTNKGYGTKTLDYSAIWSLRHAGGTSFYLYNELNNLYLNNPSSGTLTAEPSATYTFEIIDAENNQAELKCGSETLHLSNACALMSYDSNDPASRWYIATIDVTSDIENILNEITANDYADVPALGQYTTAAYNALVEARTSATTVEAVEAAIAAFKASKNIPVYFITSVATSAASFATGKAILYNGSAWRFETANKYNKQMWMTIPSYTEENVPTVDSYDAANTYYEICDYLTGTVMRGKKVQIVKIENWDGAYNLQYGTATNDAVQHAQNGGALVGWNPATTTDCPASAWNVEYIGNSYDLDKLTDEKIAALAALQTAYDAKAYYKNATIGTALGEYTGDNATLNTALENAEGIASKTLAEQDGLSTDDITSAATAINNATVPTLNMPVAGTYIRIKSVAEWGAEKTYLSSANATESSRAAFVADADASTIFYFDGTQLVSYASGNYLVNNSNFLGYNGVQTAGTSIAFEAASDNLTGAYNIIFNGNGNRKLYTNQNGYTDAAGSGESGLGYDFNLEEVTELPVTITAAGYATFYAPVDVTYDGIEAYYTIGEVKEEKYLQLVDFEGTIPATDGAILKGNEGTYYLTIISGAEKKENNNLTGSIATTVIPKEAANSYYVLGRDTNGNVGLYNPINGENTDVFTNTGHKAYMLMEGAAQTIGYSLGFDWGGTTGIENIEDAVEENATKAIYDITGRQIKAITVPGIYIINGKKTFVK